MKSSINVIKKEFDDLLRTTESLTFPFLSSREKKEQLLSDQKMKIDTAIEKLIGDINITETEKYNIWEKAKDEVHKEFSTLPKKHVLNSFYYQELMHRYVEGLYQNVIKKIETKEGT